MMLVNLLPVAVQLAHHTIKPSKSGHRLVSPGRIRGDLWPLAASCRHYSREFLFRRLQGRCWTPCRAAANPHPQPFDHPISQSAEPNRNADAHWPASRRAPLATRASRRL
jgi:hypothetical protein